MNVIQEYIAETREKDKDMLALAKSQHKKERMVKVAEKTWICVPKSMGKRQIKAKIAEYQEKMRRRQDRWG